MRRTACLIAAALSLAACQKQTAEPEWTPDTTVVPPTIGGVDAPPAQRTDAVAPDAPNTIPSAMHGRWGVAKRDCERGAAAAKGLMTVEADQLVLPEARAKVRRATSTPGGGAVLALDFEGEGQSWTVASNLVLADDGQTLVREDRKPALFQRYMRCPA